VVSVSHLAPIHLGLDVHKDTISVGILDPDQQVPDVERIAHDEASVRRLVARFPDRAQLRACYEAGPTGFELARLLHSMDVRCEVIAPSLIPTAPGDKVKTDRRDCRRLAGCTAPASWWRSAFPPQRRRRCATCAAPGATWSKTSPGAQPARQVSAAPRAAMAGRVDPNPHLPGVAGFPAVRSAGSDPDVPPPLPGGRGGPQHPAGRRGGRPGRRLVWAGAVRLAGRPAGRLPRYHAAGRAHVGRRGRRLAPVRHREPVHGFCGLVPASTPAAPRSTVAGSPRPATRTCAPSWPGSAWSYQHRPSVGVEIGRRQQGLAP
jgi:hypothetical protein